MYLCTYVSIYLYIYVIICLSVCLSIYLAIYLSIYLPIDTAPIFLQNPSIHPSIVLSIYVLMVRRKQDSTKQCTLEF